MKEKLVNTILQEMLPFLNNAQINKLQKVLNYEFEKLEIKIKNSNSLEIQSNSNLINLFISAKRIEGCSEKSLRYYQTTLEKMIDNIKKSIQEITTNDLRDYLTTYQNTKNPSKTTTDNVRRVFSSFFSWLEDEDYILKSPVRRIHKIKTGTIVKETYSDENLEIMRDNCDCIRDLALIDMLASTGMRVGELVLLNIEDINLMKENVLSLVKEIKKE